MAPDPGDPVIATLPELYALTSVGDFPMKALRTVCGLLGGDKAVWTEGDRVEGDMHFLVDPVPDELPRLREAREQFMTQHPVLAHTLATTAVEPRLISDFLRRSDFHRLELYGEFFAPLGVEDQITVSITAPGSRRVAGVSVDRGQFGFSDADRRTLARLRPHLIAAYDNAVRFTAALARRHGDIDERYAAALDRLTDRQREVLALIAAGQTNAQLANALGLSYDTVRKHVENVLKRLGVSNRTTAAIYFARGRPSDATEWTATVKQMI